MNELNVIVNARPCLCLTALKCRTQEETLFDPKCTIHHISDTKFKQYTHMHMHMIDTCT